MPKSHSTSDLYYYMGLLWSLDNGWPAVSRELFY